MKNIKVSRRQILRTIQAACIALFFAASAGRAGASPTFSPDFVLSPDGTTVTVAGSPNDGATAFFTDPSPNAYAFTISSAANIGNTSNAFHSGNLISFDNGSVNNAGTLTASHYTIVINSTTATSTVTNSGSISTGTTAGDTAIYLLGNGTVNNQTGGTINGKYTVYIAGAGTVNNAGTISSSAGPEAVYIGASGTVNNSNLITSQSGYGVKIVGTGTVNNAAGATISGSTVSSTYSAIYIEGDGTINNAGTLSGNFSGVWTSGNGTVTNASTGTISTSGVHAGVTIRADGTVSNAGTISGYYAGVYIQGAGGASSVTNAASGTITGTSTSNYSTGVGFGGPGSSAGTSSFYLVNYGTISGSATYSDDDVKAYGVTASSYSGNINISNGGGGVISGTATVSGYYTASGSGIYARSNTGTITVTNNATATGSGSATEEGSASGYGIATSNSFGPTTIVNNGTATGTGSGYYSGKGFGISANSDDGDITIVNNGTATGTGTASGYSNPTVVIAPLIQTISGPTASGYGIYANTNGNVTITNNGTATGMGTASGGYSSAQVVPLVGLGGGGTAIGYGIYAISSSGTISVTNNGTATGTGSGYYSGTGYGIATSALDNTTIIVNNSTATGTGSAYYTGIGYGIAATSDDGTTIITNNGTATGTGTAASDDDIPSATGYGIYATTNSGYIQIFNNCAATGNGTATSSSYGGSASAYGYGIYATSNSGTILIQNCGQATGTGSGFYNGTGAGIYAFSNNGAITIVNNGLASGSGSASSYYSFGIGGAVVPEINGLGDPAFGYGIYAKSNGPITINNLCDAFGNATAGSFENIIDPEEFGIPDATIYATGIRVHSAGSGPILINNSGTASGSASSYGTGSSYAYGINVSSTGSASVTINNSGVVTGVAGSFAGTGSGYGIFIGSPTGGDRPIGSGPITITNQVSGFIGGGGFTGPGSASSYGIYLQNGTGAATITNKGTISGAYGSGSDYASSGFGIYAKHYTGSITVNEIGGAVTTGSSYYIPAGPDSILLGSGVNTVNMVGQVNNTDLVDGGVGGSNTLTMHLAGMTPTQKAALIAAVAATSGGGASGPIFAGGVTYSWVDFNSVSGSFVSLEQAVDPGLMNVATKIDNLPSYLGTAFGPFYVDAASNPEAALNSLVGREFDDAVGVISKNDATALSEVFDSRAFDLRSGTGGFDLSGLNITSGSMIASLGQTSNMLDRLMGASALGGTRMSDSKEVIAPAANTNRWGAWASGTVTLADESTTDSGPGFNYTTGSPTIGADYRVCNHLAIGVLANYSTTGANFADGSRLGVQTGLGALYGTWSDGPWYANALAGGGYSSYDNHRVTLTGDTASSSPDGDEVLANLTGGYDFKLGGGWTVSPEGGFLYTHVTENGYTESGASAYDLTLGDQDIDSLRSKLGFRLTDNFKWDGIAFTPQIRASWYHEILDDSRGVATSLGAAPTLGSFTVQTNTEGRDFADLGAGLSATPAELSGDVTFFVNYDAQVGQDNFVSHTVNGGLRVNF